MSPIGIIAGNRSLPLLLARNLKRQGLRVVVVAHEGESLPEIAAIADAMLWIKVGQIGKLLRFFEKQGVKEVAFAGGLDKSALFSRLRPDRKALAILSRLLKGKGDDAVLRALADYLEEQGLKVINPIPYLTELLAAPGVLTRRKPNAEEKQDVEFGWRVLKELGQLDIGQSVVVKKSVVLAVEAIEGTDAAIRRGGQLGRGGAIIVKAAKPNQDLRFDQPAVGLDTVRLMHETAARVLAVEAGSTLIFDKEEAIKLADRYKISLVAI